MGPQLVWRTMEVVTIGSPVNSWSLMPTMLILMAISWRTCMSDPPLAPLSMSCVATLLAQAKTHCLRTLAMHLASFWVVDVLTERS